MKVSLVGAGPGDPGLFTIKGYELLANADVVIYDALANTDLLEIAKKDAEIIYVGKIADEHALPQDQINELLAAKATEGKNVVRLKGGDPYIFGRGGEEAEYLVDRGIPFEEVPGISSAIAAPAYAGIALTQRDFTSSLTILTGHENPHKQCSAHNWEALAQSGSTLVFVMGMKNLPSITDKLLYAGMDPHTPAAIVYRGTTPQQRTLISTLDKLAEDAQQKQFTNPSVIIIGKVVSLHNKLDWYSKKPLIGRRIVVTRAREQASDLVNALSLRGADIIQCPSIEICPLADYMEVDGAIAKLEKYRWLIFTSVNGVDYFWQRLERAGLDSRALGNAKIAAIGPATALALTKKGIKADLVPKTYMAEEVAKAIVAVDGPSLTDSRMLLPRAAKARMVLPDELARAGAIVDVAPVYQTVPGIGCKEKVLKLLKDGSIDCVTFGSSSTVVNFFNMFPDQNMLSSVVFAAIGPVTKTTLAEYGFKAQIMPKEYTIPALVEAITQYFCNKGIKK